ncbi:ABC transporter permease [Mycobacterium triplex]|uniref:ABC transporter permease n=1 Tax=Mycobacterium triplex TaxID=47839 RepID=A0A024JUA3_9MYCO|nr:ABC transporter permease [Mycobacterium triplex]ORX02453.1 ABC transporter permease [Mycobacterium triplex]CDO87154.1 integral membrane protein YrbE3B [Mycobacterium triplex]
MSTSTFADQWVPRAARIRELRDGWRRLGEQTRFYGKALGSVAHAVIYYRAETLRQIAAMSLGTGSLAIIGGTVAVVSFITMSNAGALASQGYNQLSQIGVEALNGFASAFVNTRLVIPFTAGIAFAATIGAGSTAQLGAMRINEEIDALEVMGIRSIAYLASTRIGAGVLVVIPLYCVGLLLGYTAGFFVTTLIYGQSSGVYQHYFDTFLIPADLLRSFVVTIAEVTVIMLIHTYHGYTAAGGPAGVGKAVGRATRTSLIGAAFIVLFVTLALYGQTGNFNFAG